jgi:hypothetical protein
MKYRPMRRHHGQPERIAPLLEGRDQSPRWGIEEVGRGFSVFRYAVSQGLAILTADLGSGNIPLFPLGSHYGMV